MTADIGRGHIQKIKKIILIVQEFICKNEAEQSISDSC